MDITNNSNNNYDRTEIETEGTSKSSVGSITNLTVHELYFSLLLSHQDEPKKQQKTIMGWPHELINVWFSFGCNYSDCEV